jgi:hypothetical protein
LAGLLQPRLYVVRQLSGLKAVHDGRQTDESVASLYKVISQRQ